MAKFLTEVTKDYLRQAAPCEGNGNVLELCNELAQSLRKYTYTYEKRYAGWLNGEMYDDVKVTFKDLDKMVRIFGSELLKIKNLEKKVTQEESQAKCIKNIYDLRHRIYNMLREEAIELKFRREISLITWCGSILVASLSGVASGIFVPRLHLPNAANIGISVGISLIMLVMSAKLLRWADIKLHMPAANSDEERLMLDEYRSIVRSEEVGAYDEDGYFWDHRPELALINMCDCLENSSAWQHVVALERESILTETFQERERMAHFT